MKKWYISILDKETGNLSKRVQMEDVIYNQNEIEFEFGEFGEEDYETLPYDDFLFFKDNYKLVLSWDEEFE